MKTSTQIDGIRETCAGIAASITPEEAEKDGTLYTLVQCDVPELIDDIRNLRDALSNPVPGMYVVKFLIMLPDGRRVSSRKIVSPEQISGVDSPEHFMHAVCDKLTAAVIGEMAKPVNQIKYEI